MSKCQDNQKATCESPFRPVGTFQGVAHLFRFFSSTAWRPHFIPTSFLVNNKDIKDAFVVCLPNVSPPVFFFFFLCPCRTTRWLSTAANVGKISACGREQGSHDAENNIRPPITVGGARHWPSCTELLIQSRHKEPYQWQEKRKAKQKGRKKIKGTGEKNIKGPSPSILYRPLFQKYTKSQLVCT